MSKKITFTNVLGWDFFPPKPAVNDLPKWYKDTASYHTKEQKKEFSNEGATPHTIKKCMPVFDAMTAGYILYTQVDVEVSQQDGQPYFKWIAQDAIGFHAVEQAALHPYKNGAPYPKWNSPFTIKTPPGYSTLFVPPLHNPNGIFTVFPGIVDTDKYTATVNFPFVLNDVNWTGIIEAGTPIVQVIPFKRDSWKQKTGSAKDVIEEKKVTAKLRTLFYNSYKRQFWERKEYK